jgi:DNA processing protein
MSGARRPADRRELAARLALLAVPGLRAEDGIALIESTGSARRACDAIGDAFGATVAAAARTPEVRERTRRALHAVERQNLHVVTFDDELYPASLGERLGRYRPPLLFGRGDLALLQYVCVGVVGSRSASEYGLDVADELADAVARAGGCVVSGVALGVDAAAHAAALDAGGATIGVLGCGVDVFYPRRNEQLQERIAQSGLLLSEHLPGEPPRKHQFPYRNRIIAALSAAVVIVEAGEKSGALSTAGHAGDQGIDVFAVPNAIDRPNMAGILRLYREGAGVYTGVRDLLAHVGLIGVADPAPGSGSAVQHAPPDAMAARVWQELGHRGRHADAIAGAAGLSPADVLVTLLQLELDGYATQLAGGRYIRRRQPKPVLRRTAEAAPNSESVAG